MHKKKSKFMETEKKIRIIKDRYSHIINAIYYNSQPGASYQLEALIRRLAEKYDLITEVDFIKIEAYLVEFFNGHIGYNG
jgi:hypothetical protein